MLLNYEQLKTFKEKHLWWVLHTPLKGITVNDEFPSNSTFWIHYSYGLFRSLDLWCRNGKPFYGEIYLDGTRFDFQAYDEIAELCQEIFDLLQPSVTKLYNAFMKKAYF